MTNSLSRRDLLKRLGLGAAAIALPFPLSAGPLPVSLADPAFVTTDDTDEQRLAEWSSMVRDQARQLSSMTMGTRAVRIGELAVGTPYEAFTLEAYIKEGGNPVQREPLALTLTRFDCVTLVESCLAIARASASAAQPSWQQFGREVERMRYRGGRRRSYASRLHYFSEWISDGENRGLVRDLGEELGGVADPRPLRFMTEHRGSYPALANDSVFGEIGSMERRLDKHVRFMIPADRITRAQDRIESGDVLAFATSIPGLDVSHAAFAYRDTSGILRVLHAPLSGGAVEITRATLPEYVANIRRATGILVARPLRG
ncbi:MAG: N-acetylmuramoyl-L-alanine amidase-like domain-containing protein [Gemmatimonadaceae bacterium]